MSSKFEMRHRQCKQTLEDLDPDKQKKPLYWIALNGSVWTWAKQRQPNNFLGRPKPQSRLQESLEKTVGSNSTYAIRQHI